MYRVCSLKNVPVTKTYGLAAYPPLTWKLITPGFKEEVCVCPPPPPKKIVVITKNKPAVKVVSVPLKQPVAVSVSAAGPSKLCIALLQTGGKLLSKRVSRKM